MSGLIGVLIIGLLFAGFALISRERDRSKGCGSCPEEKESEACDTCPLAPDRTKLRIEQ